MFRGCPVPCVIFFSVAATDVLKCCEGKDDPVGSHIIDPNLVRMDLFILNCHANEQHGKNVFTHKKNISVYFYILMQYRECTITVVLKRPVSVFSSFNR